MSTIMNKNESCNAFLQRCYLFIVSCIGKIEEKMTLCVCVCVFLLFVFMS